MPELPEVETVKRQLEKKVIGKKIQDIVVNKPKQFRGRQSDIKGKKIDNIQRRAKYIILTIAHEYYLVIHLKMTGQLVYKNKDGFYGGGHASAPMDDKSNLIVPNKYTHITISFKDGSVLYYNDLRQFGWMRVLDKKQLDKLLKEVGPEPLDKNFNLDKFKKVLKLKPKGKIKSTLMDQKIIAGIGNIYASEICFMAGVMPTRSVSSLKNEEFEKLFEAMKKILPMAIKYQGTSSNDYVTLTGKQGGFEKYLQVYGRDGQGCPGKCGGLVKKMKLAQRGTYYCSKCQK